MKMAKALIKKLEACNAELEEQAKVNFKSSQTSTELANKLVCLFQMIIHDHRAEMKDM